MAVPGPAAQAELARLIAAAPDDIKMLIEVAGTVVLMLYREDVIDKADMRDIVGIIRKHNRWTTTIEDQRAALDAELAD